MTGTRLRQGLILAALWAIPGTITAFQSYLLSIYKEDPLTFSQVLLWRFLPWQLWALATPLVLRLYRRFPLRRGVWRKSLPIHLLANALLAVLDVSLSLACGIIAIPNFIEDYPALGMLTPMLLKGWVFELFIYWTLIAIHEALEYRQRHAQTEARLVEAQLDALQMQLQPHFLFNTLNAISVLMRKGDTNGAIKMLGGLSDLLRRTLSSVRVQHVPLSEELDFLQRYLDIETTRFSDRLRVVVDAEAEVLSAQVPNMILQPIVENAIKHGLAPRATGGRIEIRARAREGTLRIEVTDDGVGLAKKNGAGVGLAHVEQRLHQLYPHRHRFTLEARPEGGAVATLEIPLEPSPEQVRDA